MYNEFTEKQQKALVMNKVSLDAKVLPRLGKRKKFNLHSKNPYKIKKVKLPGQQDMKEKVLDGFLLLKLFNKTQSENALIHPREIINADISYKRITGVRQQNLKHFVNLRILNCSQNYVQLDWLKHLQSLQNLNLANNCIDSFEPELFKGFFNSLSTLNLSYNKIPPSAILHLASLPQLQNLSLASNDLNQLPQDLSGFTRLKRLQLGSNFFSSEHKANYFWESLATIQNLSYLSIQRNQLRGIHTDRLSMGDFLNLKVLDFSYNTVENQHNLICARNFSSLQHLIITGNPFAISGQFKGLQMQIYARTMGQVVNQDIQYHYLRKKKRKRFGVKFDRIVKIKPDDWGKGNKYLFGMEMPDPNQYEDDQPQPQENQQEKQPQQEQPPPMFVTQDLQPPKVVSHRHKASANSRSSQQSVVDRQKQRQQRQKRYQQSDFRKMAQMMLSKQKAQSYLDINSVYKQLKIANKKAQEDIGELIKGR